MDTERKGKTPKPFVVTPVQEGQPILPPDQNKVWSAMEAYSKIILDPKIKDPDVLRERVAAVVEKYGLSADDINRMDRDLGLSE